MNRALPVPGRAPGTGKASLFTCGRWAAPKAAHHPSRAKRLGHPAVAYRRPKRMRRVSAITAAAATSIAPSATM
ncbi:hypothetical protein GCM10009780_74640 [Actinomadura alba]